MEDDFRRELDRQRTMTQSILTDGRIRAAKQDEEISLLQKQAIQFHLKGDVVDSMRRTLEVIEERTHDL